MGLEWERKGVIGRNRQGIRIHKRVFKWERKGIWKSKKGDLMGLGGDRKGIGII